VIKLTKYSKKYMDLLEFRSIKKYLSKAIGKKKNSVSENLSLQEKIESINLTAYMRGILVFFEYSKLFEVPSDIIDFWKKNRDNDENLDKLESEIENYPTWLIKNKLSESTAITYQTHIRGFLTNNNIRLTFKNYTPKTLKKKQLNQLGITYETMKRFAEKVKDFIKDLDLQLLIEFLHRTGLAFREIADITFKDFKLKDYEQDYILFAEFREKSSVEFANYISNDLQELILAYLRQNQDKKDSDKIFGNNIAYAYHKLDLKFNTAYIKCCKAYFPRFLNIKTSKGNIKKLFSLHSFRSVFKTTCDNLRIIPEHRDLFIAHKSDKMTNYDLVSDDLLNDYKLVENELFGLKNPNEQDAINQVFDILKSLVSNNGKRKALHRKFVENETIDMDIELKGAILLETYKNQIKTEIKNEMLNEVMKEVKERIAKIPLKELLTSL